MKRVTKHTVVNTWVESSGDRSEGSVVTCSEDTGTARDTAPEEIDSWIQTTDEGPENTSVFSVLAILVVCLSVFSSAPPAAVVCQQKQFPTARGTHILVRKMKF
jgi:hypothetical protein